VRPDEREVAGLTCSQVMAALSDYADGDAPPDLRVRIEAHVAGCGQCAAFGGDFVALLAAMRRQLGPAGDAPADVLARVRAAISR
jgi:anti-sigma factor RsiW